MPGENKTEFFGDQSGDSGGSSLETLGACCRREGRGCASGSVHIGMDAEISLIGRVTRSGRQSPPERSMDKAPAGELPKSRRKC